VSAHVRETEGEEALLALLQQLDPFPSLAELDRLLKGEEPEVMVRDMTALRLGGKRESHADVVAFSHPAMIKVNGKVVSAAMQKVRAGEAAPNPLPDVRAVTKVEGDQRVIVAARPRAKLFRPPDGDFGAWPAHAVQGLLKMRARGGAEMLALNSSPTLSPLDKPNEFAAFLFTNSYRPRPKMNAKQLKAYNAYVDARPKSKSAPKTAAEAEVVLCDSRQVLLEELFAMRKESVQAARELFDEGRLTVGELVTALSRVLSPISLSSF
jgi:hypothetical protein